MHFKTTRRVLFGRAALFFACSTGSRTARTPVGEDLREVATVDLLEETKIAA